MMMHPDLTKTMVNDPSLTRLVSVRVLRPFCVGGQRQEIGAEVEVPFHTALDLLTLGKSEII